ncbi:MAG: hypothetical protein ACI31A_00900 [Candidatus Limisoma sp.]
MDSKNKRLSARAWFEQISVAFIGTFLGIIVTVGVTFWQQRNSQHEMAEKITQITLYNIGLRIHNFQEHLSLLEQQQAAYDSIMTYMPDRLEEINPDSLKVYYMKVNYLYFGMHDMKTEEIFESSIDVWKAFDDIKVINRISNCYSILDFCEQKFELLNNYMLTASNELNCTLNNRKVSILDETGYFVQQPSTTITYNMIKELTPLLSHVIEAAEELNKQNIKALGYTPDQLRKIGNLSVKDE